MVDSKSTCRRFESCHARHSFPINTGMSIKSFRRHSIEQQLAPVAIAGANKAIRKTEYKNGGKTTQVGPGSPTTLRGALMYPDQNVRYSAFTAILDVLDLNYTIDGKSYREASKYVFVDIITGETGDEIKVRFADHINQSKYHFRADFNSTTGSDAAAKALDHILDELVLDGQLAEMVKLKG